MQWKRVMLLLACLILVLTSAAHAQPLAKRHQLELKIGFWNQTTDVRTTVGASGVSTSVGSSGGLGGISYGYWLEENVALNLSASGMVGDVEAEVGSSGVRALHAVVAPVLFGVKYYPFQAATNASTRPYLKVAAGPFFGAQSSATVNSSIEVEERRETVFGGQFAGGADFILGRRAMLGASVGYNLMSDFDQPIGGSTNYSGPEFAIGISLLLGSGVEQ